MKVVQLKTRAMMKSKGIRKEQSGKQRDKPLAVGFGISTPEQAAAVGEIADGVIVGSALIKVVGQADDPLEAAKKFIRSLKGALMG